MRQLIVDTETTGLNPVLGHKIIEFAALEMIDRKLTGNSLHIYINPERLIEVEASNIHGITDEDVKDKPIFKDVVNDIISYISDAELIIHNAKFDIGFMDHQFSELGLGLTKDYVNNVVDTLMLARQKFPGGRNSLDALCDKFNIDRSNREYHGALIDCHLLAHVYLTLTREQISLLQTETVVSIAEEYNFTKIDSSSLNLKILMSTDEEQNLHNKYLHSLNQLSNGKCIWFNRTQ